MYMYMYMYMYVYIYMYMYDDHSRSKKFRDVTVPSIEPWPSQMLLLDYIAV